MSLRFRRTLRLAPGVRLNFGLRGMSVSAGPRGLSLTAGRGGVFGNLGLPGTGVSFREKLVPPGARAGTPTLSSLPAGASALGDGVYRVSLNLDLDEHGRLVFKDAAGLSLDPRLERIVKRDHTGELEEFLACRCDEINAGGAEIVGIHTNVPPPDQAHHYQPRPYGKPAPERPSPPKPGFLDRLFPWLRHDKEQEFGHEMDHFRKLESEWKQEKELHDAEQERLRKRYEQDRLTDPAVMSDFLEESFAIAGWPRETRVDFDLEDGGARLTLDVDLPEVEDMPVASAERAARGLKLNIKKLSEGSIRGTYSVHVHGVVFRCLGLAFATLPSVQTVTCAAYTQRADPATGRVRDIYLLSVVASRSEWRAISFANLQALDVIEALERFDLRLAMSADGALEPILPHARLHGEQQNGVEAPARPEDAGAERRP
jgi:hypothetical protein